jgi:hypothetical protein
MSSEYKLSEDGNNRILVAIVCDSCGAKISPYPDIFRYDWVMNGYGKGIDFTVKEFCPDCV